METFNVSPQQSRIPAYRLTCRFSSESSTGPDDQSGPEATSAKAPDASLESRPTRDLVSRRVESHILLVEDNPADITLIRQSLKEHNITLELVLVTDGQMAVRYLDSISIEPDRCPALVILDLNLPKTSGLEVLQRLRELAVFATVPVVVFSSSDAARDRAEVSRLGADRYICKPSNLDEFLGIGAILKGLLPQTPTQH